MYLALTFKTLVVNRYFNVFVGFFKHTINHVPIGKFLGTYTQCKQTIVSIIGFPLETFLNE